MSIARRRLSQGKALIGVSFKDDFIDDNDIACKGSDLMEFVDPAKKEAMKKSGSRRKSIFGVPNLGQKSPPLNSDEQKRIVDMYKVVIQMSTENVRKFKIINHMCPLYIINIFTHVQKLNEKNSWNYDLIDHMGRLLKDEDKEVNFQKVTIFASRKYHY
jgi:hypothetical protein